MIPARAVEAAHIAVYGKEAPMVSRQVWLEEALEAAAPYMLAQAWDEGHKLGQSAPFCPEPNPYRPTQ